MVDPVHSYWRLTFVSIFCQLVKSEKFVDIMSFSFLRTCSILPEHFNLRASIQNNSAELETTLSLIRSAMACLMSIHVLLFHILLVLTVTIIIDSAEIDSFRLYSTLSYSPRFVYTAK
jgi:hypothetical protein